MIFEPGLGMNMNLAPVRHEEVEVCGAMVLAVIAEDGKAYFSPRHVCGALGITWQGQLTKIKADEVLSSVVTEIVTTAADGKNYKTTMLPIELLPGWLFTIKKVRPEVQAKLNQFRAEAFLALDAWFRKGLRGTLNVQGITERKDFKPAAFGFLNKSGPNKELSVFEHSEFGALRVAMVDENDTPWFVAKDVCDALGTDIKDSSLDEDEKSYLSREQVGLKPGRNLVIINESGLYSLILRSRKQEAKKFKKWVTSEVLPSIRKHGSYAMIPAYCEGSDSTQFVFGRKKRRPEDRLNELVNFIAYLVHISRQVFIGGYHD